MESLLLLTTNQNGPHRGPRVLMDDAETTLDLQSFPQVLFERLLLESPSNLVIGSGSEEAVKYAGQPQAVVYLFHCFGRCLGKSTSQSSVVAAVQSAVVTNLATALEQPEIYFGQNIEQQLKDILLKDLSEEYYCQELMNKLTQHLQEQKSPKIPVFDQVLIEITSRLSEATLMTVDYKLINILDYYASNTFLATDLTMRPGACVSLETNQDRSGRGYQNTPLGSLLAVSCLPKHLGQNQLFFQNPTKMQVSDIKATENSIWMAQNGINTRIYKIFYALLKVSSEGRSGLLSWVEGCLEANGGRAGLWQVHGQVQGTMYVCDGFMTNLGAVMLQLAQPFTQEPKSPKILKIDHRYCKSPSKSTNSGVEGAYTGDLGKQTCLVPPPEGDENLPTQEIADQYSFVTSCFFLTHRALHLGVQVVSQKLYKLEQEVGRMRHQFQEVIASGTATPLVRQQMETTENHRMTQLYSLKAAIFEPNTSENLLQFMATSAEWMVQCALNSPSGSNAPQQQLLEVKVPLPSDEVPHLALQYIPEFLVENLTETIKATRRYNPQLFDSGSGTQALPHLMSFIVVFMGSPGRMNNPHLRAHLAESMETLLPNNGNSTGMMAGLRDALFTSHPASPHIVTAIIHVFVTIEVSAQAVAFEEKFNYRKPMFEVMKYLWEVPAHQERFKTLAKDALANMEAAKPPLFLQFVNVLINDAIFLLGEGLDYLMQIKKLLKEKDDGEWNNLTSEQKQEKENSVHHLTLMARFHNMMGTSTIRTLIRLTKEIPEMFTHPTLVDRMAAMLNYFLAHLVGPKQRDLKLNDMDKYEFRPGEMVTDICIIYTQLGNDEAFPLAISQDGRSYSPMLFQQAHDVLCRVGRGGLAGELLALRVKVEVASQANQEVEDLATEAPEEYLDPIMSHLMTDPVTLPSSLIVCDRSTIARHLLSDQTDPFNRQPLTMDEVLPNTELKNTISQWLIQKKAENQKKESEMT